MSRISKTDGLIRRLLKDPQYEVRPCGQIFTCTPSPTHGKAWRETGYLSHSRNGRKRYLVISYKGVMLYVHRIIFAAFGGRLNSSMTVNHKDLDGLNNNIENLELISHGANLRHACEVKRRGMSGKEAKANWVAGRKVGRNWRGKK